MNKVIDGFTFYNEFKLLDFRLEYLYEYVDYFVVVESNKTFSNKDKPYYFNENKERYDRYLDKIINVMVDDMPNGTGRKDNWNREYHQRNKINSGIDIINELHHLDDNTIIAISDLDEIPDRNVIKYYKYNGIENGDMHILGLDFYYYNLNCRRGVGSWKTYKLVNKYTYDKIAMKKPQNIRTHHRKECHMPKLSEKHYFGRAGWHFSYFGDVEFIKNKLQSFSHQEYNRKDIVNDDNIKDAIENSRDLLKRPKQAHNNAYTYIEIEDNDYLPEGYEKLLI